MKARVKATGEIVEVLDAIYDEYANEYHLSELDILDDYWTRLEHQAAIAAMQGIINNPIGFENLRALSTLSALGKALSEEVAILAHEYAHALVEKLKKGK